MGKKIGVLLSGCGVFDGAEIHESTLTLYFLDREGAEVLCMAPDTNQLHVVDHQTSQETGEQRNILTESARISRGNMQDLATDESTATDVEFFGAKQQNTRVDDIAVDKIHKIVTTPAYMLGSGISDVAKGIEKLVKQVMMWA